MIDAITDLIKDVLNWFRELWFDLVNGLFGAFAALIESIPVPEFLSGAQALQLPSSVTWFLSAFEIEFGIALYVSAITLRFILRRIPGIG